MDCDLVLLTGPCLNLKLESVYDESFQRLYKRGVKVGYVSAGMSLYDEGEAVAVKRFLDKYPPAFVSTRDQLTYDFIEPMVDCPTYSGLCTSLFLNDAYQPMPLTGFDYIVLNFDHDEPELSFGESDTATVVSRKKSLFSSKKHDLPTEIRGIPVVRTCNLSIDEGYTRIYQHPNTYHSDLPWGYCSLLKHAKCVYSERVHTCAATLILGGQAQFVAQSKRSFEKRSLLFEQIGLGDIFERPVRIDFEKLAVLKREMTDFLKDVIN